MLMLRCHHVTITNNTNNHNNASYILQTRNRHLRNNIGLSVAFSDGL